MKSLSKTIVVPLNEAAFFQEGPGLRTQQWRDAGMKVINVTNILGDGSVDPTNTDKYISLDEFETRYSHFAVEDADIVVASSGNTYGKVGRISAENLPLMMNTSVIRFHSRDTKRLNSDYLYVWLRSPEFTQQVESFVTGGAQPNFGPTHLKKMHITLPHIDRQKDVAEIITSYDKLISINRRRFELLERSALLLFEEWFVRLRYPGHEHDKVVDGCPDGWSREPFSTIVTINPRERVAKGAELWYIPMASLSEIGMVLDDADFERRTKHTTVKFRNGDTLFARITPCLENGKTGYVDCLSDGEVACGSTEFIVMRGAVVPPEFTYCLARQDFVRGRAIKSMIGSSGRQRVQESCFDDLLVNVPPELLMTEFHEFSADCFMQIRNLRKQNQALQRARDLLLPRLMDGRVAV